jgi:hypothetical protein
MELPIKVGGIISQMIFLVVNTYNYDLFLGLDFLIIYKQSLMWKRASYKFAMDLEWKWKYCH